MSEALPSEIFVLLDSRGALIVFEEKAASWVGVLAFSNQDNAIAFIKASRLDAHEIAAIDTADADSIAALIASVKRRSARHLILDLDFATGGHIQVEFEGNTFGESRARQMEPRKP